MDCTEKQSSRYRQIALTFIASFEAAHAHLHQIPTVSRTLPARGRSSRRGGRHAATAAAWIRSDREDGPFAFRNVCQVLNLSPSAVRKAARNGKGR